MSQNEDFVSFEKALRDLKIQSAELKKLVSEGEIRAFRDGDSMKFKREDLEALGSRGAEDEEFVFADSLEDDTGMVTEELSDEDTLLADDDDDLLDDEADAPVVRATATRSQRARGLDEAEESREPGWVTVAAGLACLVMFYGFFVVYSLAMETPDGIWAK